MLRNLSGPSQRGFYNLTPAQWRWRWNLLSLQMLTRQVPSCLKYSSRHVLLCLTWLLMHRRGGWCAQGSKFKPGCAGLNQAKQWPSVCATVRLSLCETRCFNLVWSQWFAGVTENIQSCFADLEKYETWLWHGVCMWERICVCVCDVHQRQDHCVCVVFWGLSLTDQLCCVFAHTCHVQVLDCCDNKV